MDKNFSFKECESRISSLWSSLDLFSYHRKKNQEAYTVIMPPPNVTGSLHMGHALTFTLQDVLVRYARKQGKHVLWQPGTDHAGIATQMVVERQLQAEGKTRHDLGREQFLQRVWEWKEHSGSTIYGQLKRLGASAAWNRDRFTMDPEISKAVITVFNRLHKDGLLYRDKRLVNWDIPLQTAISDIEVKNKTVPTSFYYIRYPLVSDPSRSIVVATTRPETLFGDMAVCVHPDDERYASLVGQQVSLPLTSRTIPIIADTWSDPEKGTGAVKITPAHDFNDFEVGKRHGLPLMEIFDEHGCLNHEAPENYQSLERFAARQKVISDLMEADLLEKEEIISSSLPYGDRSDSLTEPRLMDQWFVNVKELADNAIEEVKKGNTAFTPAFWSHTFFDWLENIQPWCVSRQLWWGHRIPAWYGPDKFIFVAENEEDAHQQAAQHYGSPVSLEQDTDVLDTWFSSALWPFVTLGWPENTPELEKHYPSSVMVTGHDIIFFWVARMMMMGLYIMKKVPFKDVYMHALVRDEKGQKMSKSKGNVVDPIVLMDQYGADALRLTLILQAAPGRDIRFSESRVEGAKHVITKLWNATRYCLMNGSTFDPDYDVATVTHPLNQWIVSKTVEMRKKISESTESYAFHDIGQTLVQEFRGTFCDWYLEFTKPILQNETTSDLKTETQKTTAWVLISFLHAMHPVMPFITEEIWQHLRGDSLDVLFSLPFPALPSLSLQGTGISKVDWAVQCVSEIRSALSILSSMPKNLRAHLISNDEGDHLALKSFEDQIMRMARIHTLLSHPETVATQKIVVPVGQGIFEVYLGEEFDTKKEKQRLSKEMEKLSKDLEAAQRKLNNADFTSRAPEEVVTELHQRTLSFQETLTKLQNALDSFA